MIVEAWQVQNMTGRPTCWRLREEFQIAFKGSLLAKFLLTWGLGKGWGEGLVFVLLRLSTD